VFLLSRCKNLLKIDCYKLLIFVAWFRLIISNKEKIVMKFLVKIGKLSPYILAVAFPAFILLIVINYLFFTAPGLDAEKPFYVEIPNDANIDQLAEVLSESHLVSSVFVAKMLLNKEQRKYDQPIRISGGEYEIPPKLMPSEIITKIITSNPISREFGIVAGMELDDIVTAVVESGLFEATEIKNAFFKTDLLVRRNIAAATPEGYFTPVRASFSKPISSDVVADTLLKKADQKRKSVFPDLLERSFKLNLDEIKILTLASLIEKSGGKNVEDKRKISSVIHNRLALGIPLENEAALIYSFSDKKKELLTSDDLKKGTPYNTFTRTGLPPTPICTPSLDSIRAALMPADSDYLYYLYNKYEGRIEFASTAEEFREKKTNAS